MHRINTAVPAERWRYKCPECNSEHWRCNDGSFTCRHCDTKTFGLIDDKTGEFVPRDEIQFVGPHANWKAKYPSGRGSD